MWVLNDENITANQHRSLIENYLQAHLDIQGEIPHRRTPEQLKMALETDKPDLIYIGACLHQGWQISLDKDLSANHIVNLNELADWIEAAQIHPVVILNFIGQPITEYPEKLVNVSKLVWIQHVKRPSKFDLLPIILEQTLQKLNSHQNDLLASIVSQSALTEVDSYVWVKGRSFQIKNDVNKHQAQQLRAALLRVMLGRNEVKKTIYYEVSKSFSTIANQIFTYVITGTKQACPFDVPAQVRQRLQWDDPEKNLAIRPLEFDLSIGSSGRDPISEIDTAQASGLGTRLPNSSVQNVLENRLDERDLLHEECCISINWFIKTNNASLEMIAEWLQEWRDIMHDDFVGHVPDNKVLLIAACLQIDDETQAQTIQDKVNQILREPASRPIRPIRHADALGRLDEYEISDFFSNNPHWHTHLKLDEYNIDTDHYTDWILQQTGGQFEETVHLIWQQYQRNYQDYTP